jgi:hypothetical protein
MSNPEDQPLDRPADHWHRETYPATLRGAPSGADRRPKPAPDRPADDAARKAAHDLLDKLKK